MPLIQNAKTSVLHVPHAIKKHFVAKLVKQQHETTKHTTWAGSKKNCEAVKKNVWNENFKSLHEINDTWKADYDKVI